MYYYIIMAIYKGKYSGAGTLIIEDYYTKNGYAEPCIILGRSVFSGLFSDFGGRYEHKHKNLKKTASTELREESANLFNISTKYFDTYVDIRSGNYYYRLYLLKINGASRMLFNHNINVFNSMRMHGIRVPRCWMEVDMIVHIPLRNINFSYLAQKGQVYVYDIDNKQIPLSGRTKYAIYSAQILIYNVIHARPVVNKNNIITHVSSCFTNGTYSFYA